MSFFSHAPLLFQDPLKSDLIPSKTLQIGQELSSPIPLKLVRLIDDTTHYQVYFAEPIGGQSLSIFGYEVWVGSASTMDLMKKQKEVISYLWPTKENVTFIQLDSYALMIREIEYHYSLMKILEDKSQDQAYLDLLNLGILLAKKLSSLHQMGYALGGFHPKYLGLNDQNQWTFLYLNLHEAYQAQSEQPHLYSPKIWQHAGYSPPEAYGHFNAKVDARSDVFSLGIMLFYALTKIKPFQETKRPFHRLPSPLIYQPLLPPELIAVIRKAISSYPARRFKDATDLLNALLLAKDSIQQREKTESMLRLEVGHDIHVGLIKGQYNPINQDDLFLGYQPDAHKGLFLISDGVSISEHGTGDIASGYVKQEAFEAWKDFIQMNSDSEDETMAELDHSFSSHVTGPELISRILNRANQRIADHVNVMIPVFHGPPEGIMAATAVLAVLEKNYVTFGSVGDSRIYLIRNGLMISLMNDDDLATHLMQMGQSPTQAYQSTSAAALINCVGEFKKNQNNQLVPSQIKPQILQMKLLPGDQIVLCSDGVPDYAGFDEEDAEIRLLEVVQKSVTATRAAFELVSLANRGGGGDNISCVVLRCHRANS
jgi:protein phosphatase